jgi:type I restriction enzyme S subunit
MNEPQATTYFQAHRLRPQTEYLPEFLARFLNCDIGRAQIDQVSRQIIGMANINAKEIKRLRVPKPPPAGALP